MTTSVDDSVLGAGSRYVSEYDASLLYPVPRSETRAALGLDVQLPFTGEDVWNAYELSWLNVRGVPVVRVGTLRCAANSPNIIESKSLKLYLNSLNNTRFDSVEKAADTITNDLSRVAGAPVTLTLNSVTTATNTLVSALPGWCIDDEEVAVEHYDVNPDTLRDSTSGEAICATVHSHLLRSCCPVTGQPDWASVVIRYHGKWIAPQALLRYIISFRNHAEFHEHCVERMFVDIKRFCAPQALTIYARYTRRGGLDINPFRSDFESGAPNRRHVRQ